MEILQDALIIFSCHTCGVAVIELFVRICLLARVSCVTCMEWLVQLGRWLESDGVFLCTAQCPGLKAMAF